MQSVIALLAVSFGLVVALAPLAQLRRIRARRSSGDVSLGWIAAYGVGCMVWLVYGISIASIPLIVCEAVALITVSATIHAITQVRASEAHAPGSRETECEEPPSAVARTVSDQVTVAEAMSQNAGASPDLKLAVVDQRGRAHGRVSIARLVETPTVERAALLIAEITEENDEAAIVQPPVTERADRGPSVS